MRWGDGFVRTPDSPAIGDGESIAMKRLRMLAADAGQTITRHAFINPDEAAAILAEIQGRVPARRPSRAGQRTPPVGEVADAIARLRQVATDAGKPTTRQTLINPDEAAAVLVEFERLQGELAQTDRSPDEADENP